MLQDRAETRIGKYEALVGERLTSRRQKLELSVSELSRRSGVSRSTLHRIEQGSDLRVGTLARVASVLGVRVRDLVTMTDDDL